MDFTIGEYVYTLGSISSNINVDNNLLTTILLTPNSNENITVSFLLENDVYYPELSHDLMLKGTELIIYPTKGNLSNTTDYILVIARVNRAYSTTTNDNGWSAVGSNYTINLISRDYAFITPPTNNKEKLIISLFDINNLRNIRSISEMGDAMRRPFRYQQLCGLQSINTTLIPSGNNDIWVTIAALQLNARNSMKHNLQIAEQSIKQANNLYNVFMPELFNFGYKQIFPGYKYGNMSNLNEIMLWIKMIKIIQII